MRTPIVSFKEDFKGEARIYTIWSRIIIDINITCKWDNTNVKLIVYWLMSKSYTVYYRLNIMNKCEQKKRQLMGSIFVSRNQKNRKRNNIYSAMSIDYLNLDRNKLKFFYFFQKYRQIIQERSTVHFHTMFTYN